MTFDSSGKSIDDILDYGAPGLGYWEYFLPLYEQAFGPLPGVVLAELQARYDEQRGMDLGKLEAARKELAEALSGAEQQWSAQRSVAHRLPVIWSGRGGTAALDLVDGQVRRARDDLDAAHSVVTAIDAVIEPLRQAVFTKAERTIGLLEQNADGEPELALGGKSPAEIEALVSEPDDAGRHWLRETFKSDVEHKLDGFATICTATDQFVADQYQVVTTALSRLLDAPYPRPDGPFEVPVGVQPRPLSEFDIPSSGPTSTGPGPDVPATAPAATTGSPPAAGPTVSNGPTAASGPTMQLGAAPSSDGQTAPAASIGPGASTTQDVPTRSGGRSVRSDPSPGSGEPVESDLAVPADRTSESSTASTSLDSLLEGIGSSLTQLLAHLSTGVQAGIDTVLGTLQDLTESEQLQNPATEPDRNPGSDQPLTSTLFGEKVEFDLAGKHLTLEPGPHGELRLVITEPTGESQSFTVKLDEHGIPTISADGQPPTDTQPDEQSSGMSPPSPEGDARPPSPRGDAPLSYEGAAPSPPAGNEQPSSNPEGMPGNPAQPSETADLPPDCPPVPPACPVPPQEGPPAPPDCAGPHPEAPGTPPIEPGVTPEDPGAPGENPGTTPDGPGAVPDGSGVRPDGAALPPDDSAPLPGYPGVAPLGDGSLPDPPGVSGVPVPPIPPLADDGAMP
ncbi:hypothetical protein HLB23_19150 [Nocardia uniformis]|uniref:Uncharacterized protein n=1 Tax=Nocardia uniformis TaxID=53432 RepID=A0A849C2J1_9NOCA|nr:hypothetical protein [Nocardia uniformis]NNH71948.1 hypothetical protein [Nocardia uniformis]